MGVVARCQAVKPSGEPCERIVPAAQKYCYSHNPAKSESRKRAASAAGKGKEIPAVKSQLRRLADDVISGEVSTGKASVGAQILGVFLRACETEIRVREQTELSERLEELERIAQSSKPQTGRRTWRA